MIAIVGCKSQLEHADESQMVEAGQAEQLQTATKNCKFQTATSALEDEESVKALFTKVSQEIIDGSYF